MKYTYVEKFFINPAIEYGISSYLKAKEGLPVETCYTFEMSIIKALTIIYGEKSILLPYKIENEKAFECNLLMYDLKESDMQNFIKYMALYHQFLKNNHSHEKAGGLIVEIEKIIIEMIEKRSKHREFTEAEIREFDTIFNPREGNLRKLKSLINTNDGLIIKKWEDRKYGLTNTQIKMMAINPNLLEPYTYSKFGYDIKTIALLSEEEIRTINQRITEEEDRFFEVEEKKKGKKRNKIILTTGNGFVDKLMILSIVATEIMIGVIILSILGGA